MNEYPFLACFITYSGIPLDTDRLLNCPLVGIKTPHGRLVEEHYHGELKAKHAEGLFAVYRSADEDPDRVILEEEI